MAIANPRIHMICGMCGNNNSLSFSFSENNFLLEGFDDEIDAQAIRIGCNNCHSGTSLDEIINEEPTQWIKITDDTILPDMRVWLYNEHNKYVYMGELIDLSGLPCNQNATHYKNLVRPKPPQL